LLARLFLLFTVVPLIELTLLLLLGRYTSVSTAVGFVIVTAIIGAVLLRWQGLAAWRKVQEDLRAGRMPTESIIDGLLIVLASVLLVTPGVLTDIIGITLLVPWFRRGYRRLASWYFQKRFAVRFTSSEPGDEPPVQPRRTEVIDSYVVEPPRAKD
jgi:UPF0716 protein FxsA